MPSSPVGCLPAIIASVGRNIANEPDNYLRDRGRKGERSGRRDQRQEGRRRAVDITVTIFLGVNEPVREGSLFSPSRRLSRMFRCREVCIRRGTKCTERRLLRAVEATNRRGVDFLIRMHGWPYVCEPLLP